jgi:hypothetical protein
MVTASRSASPTECRRSPASGVENGQPLPFKVTADIRAAGTSTLKIPTVRIPITDQTVMSLELLEGENWRVLKSKKVLLVGQQATATSN